MFLIGVGAFILSYLGVEIIRRLALRHRVLDVPNERSSHSQPTPRGGGLAIAVIVLVGFGVACGQLGDLTGNSAIGFLVGAGLVAGISIVDDIVRLPARLRLLVHLIAAVIFVALAGRLEPVSLPGLGNIDLGGWGTLITLIWVVGLINIYNFMDGIDGLAGGQAVLAGLCWLIALVGSGPNSLAMLTCLVLGASLGFLVHNWPPARIFMGDVGSTLLGYTFATLPVLACQQTGDWRMAVFGVFCIAPFVFDGAFTLVRRALKRENILQAHRTHLYQRLIQSGYSHGQVSAIYGGLAATSGLMGLLGLASSESGLGLLVAIEAAILIAYALWVRTRENLRSHSPAV